ncbi:hypothetical protein REH81_00430 [Vibrio rotiferianus]
MMVHPFVVKPVPVEVRLTSGSLHVEEIARKTLYPPLDQDVGNSPNHQPRIAHQDEGSVGKQHRNADHQRRLQILQRKLSEPNKV